MDALHVFFRYTMCVLIVWLTFGCLDRRLQPINPCLVSGVVQQVEITNLDKVDLLFVIDNSSSMEDKQANLRRHVPQLVHALVSGSRGPDDPNPFPPVHDLHIAVVDSDMGLPGVSGIPGCVAHGHDGLFQNTPHPSPENPVCDSVYPSFLRYNAHDPTSPSAAKIAQDFGCIANVGAMGCGFEQQLEAGLKALWPASDARVQFLGALGAPERFGHGDRENTGFLRSDPALGLSLLAIVVLSDEDDGSTGETELYLPASALPANTWVEPSTQRDLNLRALIGANREHLFPVERYIQGWKALRPGQENLVVFAAITGVPLDLVDEQARAQVSFKDRAQRDAYYDRILADPRMQHVPDGAPSPTQHVLPACQTAFGRAYPGRRYIEIAKGFGENASVYSVCEPDYTPALNQVIDLIAERIQPVCLPRPLTRDGSGLVSCDVVWELPTETQRTTLDAPVTCSERPSFLQPPPAEQPQRGAQGGHLCTVTQVPALDGTLGSADGWYYDDFSADLKRSCAPTTPRRVAFSPAAKPPTGVRVRLVCLNETQLISNRDPAAAPDAEGRIASIGTPCDSAVSAQRTGAADADRRCSVQRRDGSLDERLFCHPKRNTCVRACAADSDCPPAWVCDARAETLADTASSKRPQGSGICVNPTCGL